MKSIHRGNIYVLAVLVNQLLVMLLSPFLMSVLPPVPYSIAIYTALTQVLCFLPPFLAYLLLAKPVEMFAFKRINLTNAVLIVFMCLAIQPAMAVLSAVSAVFFENNVSGYMETMYALPLPVAIMIMAVIPAFFEELTLRGVVLGNYREMPIKKAALINGLFFGIMHLSLQQFLYAFMMGAVFSFFVYYTKSLWASMLGHFTVNASQVLLAFASYSVLESLPEEALAATEAAAGSEIINTVIFMAVVTAIFLPVFLILFRAFIGYNKRRIFLDAMSCTAEGGVQGETDVLVPGDVIADESATEAAPADAPPHMEAAPPRDGKVVDWAFVCVLLIYVVVVGVFDFILG